MKLNMQHQSRSLQDHLFMWPFAAEFMSVRKTVIKIKLLWIRKKSASSGPHASVTAFR